MAKKERIPSRTRFRSVIPILFILAGAWWVWESDVVRELGERFLQYVENRDIVTLEVAFSPEQLFEEHRHELLGSEKRSLQHAVLKYYPYLLLDVKYPDGSVTREGAMLWGLHDGEMVINTESWELTHGFRDCLECRATRNDFKILQTLARRHGALSLEELQKELRAERETLQVWVEEAKRKHLILQKGSLVQLHFENPKLWVLPQTKIKHPFVSKPLGDGEKVSRIYSRRQIVEMIPAAFGSEVKIRREQEIFLPTYSLEILNSDGSVQMSEWNALTGQRMAPRYLGLVKK